MYIHKILRPNQSDTLERIRQSKHKFIVVFMPTGTGKTFLPSQLAAMHHKTLSLVQTKALQLQYVNYTSDIDAELSFNGHTSITGKGDYECLHAPEQLEIFGRREIVTADTCTMPDKEKRYSCVGKCPYPIARNEFIEATGAVTNYSKFLLDYKLIEQFDPEYLFCDEAHMLSDVTVDYAGLQFNWNSKEFQKYGSKFITTSPQPIAFNEVRNWLGDLVGSMYRNKPLKPENGGSIKSFLWHKRRLTAIENTLKFMEVEPSSWYIESDNEGLRVRPKTARFNFVSLFDRAEKIVLMSATIDYHTLRELGIKDFEFISVPNPYPPPLRRIEDLGCPGIGYKSSHADLDLQAKKIADRLNKCPENWTGLIHVNSKNQAYSLGDRLMRLTDRELYIPARDIGTEQVAENWGNHRHNGTIGIFWQLWEGYDGVKDKINIVAKIPYPEMRFERGKNGKKDIPIGYDTHRFLYDKAASHSRTAAKMVQGLGRIRRGNSEDYGDNKVVCIADGNWKRLRKYVSKDILESIS